MARIKVFQELPAPVVMAVGANCAVKARLIAKSDIQALPAYFGATKSMEYFQEYEESFILR
jgi:hypothetical protein